MIELHSSPTPNGQKVMIMLEETGIEWKHIDVDINVGEQFQPEHLKLNPNNKIPAIVDTEGPEDSSYTMMESGAILLYLAEKTGKFLPVDMRKRYDTLQWLFFQVAHIGPMFGQANHFNRQARDNQYARDRYNNESLRLYRVLENRLVNPRGLGAMNIQSPILPPTPGVKGMWSAASMERPSQASCAGLLQWRLVPQCSAIMKWQPKFELEWKRRQRRSLLLICMTPGIMPSGLPGRRRARTRHEKFYLALRNLRP